MNLSPSLILYEAMFQTKYYKNFNKIKKEKILNMIGKGLVNPNKFLIDKNKSYLKSEEDSKLLIFNLKNNEVFYPVQIIKQIKSDENNKLIFQRIISFPQTSNSIEFKIKNSIKNISEEKSFETNNLEDYFIFN